MKRRKNKIPGKIGLHQLSPHFIQRMKERKISALDIEKALKNGEIENSILRYKHLEIVLSEDKSNMVTAWNNGKERSKTVISKKEQKLLSSKFSEKFETEKDLEVEDIKEFDTYEEYIEFLKSKP